jgi:pimeloyl-ACP methyl ester carboxylesterase
MLLALLMVVALFVVSASATGDKNPKKSDLPAALPTPLDEQEYVKIGGLDQWISIRGKDPGAPVLLILHGGPGAAWSGFLQQNASWEGDFIVVRWDQRGAGRTFGRSGPVSAEVTIDRMAQDGVEVAEFVRRRLHKDRVILMGVSWGSVLGVHMIKARPDLFYAYVGTGQIVNWPRGEALAYAQVLARARGAGDRAAIDALEKIGPPPYADQRLLGVRTNWAAHFEPGALSNAELLKMPFSAPGYNAADAQNWLDGLISSQNHFFGEKMDGPFTREDLTQLGPRFCVPVFIFQGTEDDIAPASLAEAYAHSLRAPQVEYVPIAAAGHYAFMTKSDLFLRLLMQRVRPLVTRPPRRDERCPYDVVTGGAR